MLGCERGITLCIGVEAMGVLCGDRGRFDILDMLLLL
jgi:hypothetical protein